MRYIELDEYEQLRNTADGSFCARLWTANRSFRVSVAIEHWGPGRSHFLGGGRMTTLYEWVCNCGNKTQSRCKPRPLRAGMFIFKVPLCKKCKRPMRPGSAAPVKRYSLKELL